MTEFQDFDFRLNTKYDNIWKWLIGINWCVVLFVFWNQYWDESYYCCVEWESVVVGSGQPSVINRNLLMNQIRSPMVGCIIIEHSTDTTSLYPPLPLFFFVLNIPMIFNPWDVNTKSTLRYPSENYPRFILFYFFLFYGWSSQW